MGIGTDSAATQRMASDTPSMGSDSLALEKGSQATSSFRLIDWRRIWYV